ncbi:MAG: aminotransferase class V-fold PLP-dependent enzyme [Xanthomonadales bacterium]|jgi:selenocysteine lyase/cysteine desulfurase|nr:aminotransferase class V-fold PLP-dependent enzyme [Xanthomonadales bacterium]
MKRDFTLPPEQIWLNSAYLGPLPRVVQEAGERALRLRAEPWRLTPDDFFTPAERTRRCCAQLVNADPERTAFITSVASGMAVVARHLVPRPGQNVVLLGEQFPSNVYPWFRWREAGVVLRFVPAPMPASVDAGQLRQRALRWNTDLLAAIDADTAMVSVEPAHWTDGTLFDLEAISRRCRDVGAAFVIDGTQTVGAMALDVATVQPDALIVHSYKAGLSNYGLGFAVFGPRFDDALPNEESWLLREGAENFAGLVAYQSRYAAGMRRHDSSVRVNPMLIAMLEAACTLLLDWQPARTRAHLLALARPAVARLREAGFGIADEELRAANLFGIALPAGMAPEAVRQALAIRQIHVSVRGAAVRVSPHRHNDEADLLHFADALIALR